MKSFSGWTIAEVEKEFQVKMVAQFDLLDEWLDAGDIDGNDIPVETLQRMEQKLIKSVYSWNEEELKFKVIAPLLNSIDFDEEHYQAFLERPIAAPYKNDTLSGTVDFIVANGNRLPEQPYFFLHEHKKDTNSTGDPLGQVMIAMIAAQILNTSNHPLYGAYVIGRHWYFVVLSGKEYAVSLAYDVTQGKIGDVYHILKKTKSIINDLVEYQSKG
ncbi:MAG: hypothetical protein AAF639_46280 [Chloroflexota bacterium]